MIPKKIPQNSTFSVQLYTLPVTPLHAICNGEFFYSAELRLKTLQLIPTISPESMWVVLWSFLVKTWIQQNLNIKGLYALFQVTFLAKIAWQCPIYNGTHESFIQF